MGLNEDDRDNKYNLGLSNISEATTFLFYRYRILSFGNY